MKKTRSYLAQARNIQIKEDKTDNTNKENINQASKKSQVVQLYNINDVNEQSFEVNECSSEQFTNKQNEILNAKTHSFKSKKIKKRHGSISQKRKLPNQIVSQAGSNQGFQIKFEQNYYSRKKTIFTNGYGKVSETDFKIMVSKFRWQKSFSTVLLNQNGNIIYADRLGSEHFQGSLNNFERNPFHYIIVQKQRSKVLKALANIKQDQPTIIKYFIYSKNIKRRYSKVASDQKYTDQDLFFRYLKGLSTKILPIQIIFQNYKEYQGYWNHNLVKNNVPLKCFWLQTRNSAKFPAKVLKELDLSHDYTISKFIKYTMKRQQRNDQEQQNYQQGEVKSDIFSRKLFMNGLTQTNGKKDEDDYSQAKQSVRHSNTLTGNKETQRQKNNQ